MTPEELKLLLSFLPYVIFALIIGGSIWYTVYTQKKRREAMQKQARQRGWEFIAKPTTNQKAFIPSLGGSLFRSVLSVTNMLKRREHGITWFIFDGSTGSGKSKRSFNVVMAHVEDDIHIPNFMLKPESFLANLFESKKDIDIQGQPEFSKKFIIQGDDEHIIQQFFSPELTKYLMDNDIKNPIHCSHSTLMMIGTAGYTQQLTKVDNLWNFFEEKKRTLEQFIQRAERMRGNKSF